MFHHRSKRGGHLLDGLPCGPLILRPTIWRCHGGHGVVAFAGKERPEFCFHTPVDPLFNEDAAEDFRVGDAAERRLRPLGKIDAD